MAEKHSKEDVQRILGKPKITFVLGAPGAGKGTHCASLVEEFNYTHISLGDVFRAEATKGSAISKQIAEHQAKGELIPYELTVQVLINSMISTPSKNYLVDGFPRSIEQAIQFESVCCEAQSVLFFNVSQETALARCMATQDTEDNKKEFNSRYKTFTDQCMPVIDMYRNFGKVFEVSGEGEKRDIYAEARKAILPQVSFLVGPQGSGKSVLGKKLCANTNMSLVNFPDFVQASNLQDSDEETIVCALIKHLSLEVCPRILLEDFPQTVFQAKFFIKNCVEPTDIFVMKCSKDICQERMFAIGETNPSYIPSSILAKKVQIYNERARELLPYLKANCRTHEINSEQQFNCTMKQIAAVIDPCVVAVRTSGHPDSYIAEQAIQQSLLKDHGFVELNVQQLCTFESMRRTELGSRISKKMASSSNAMSDEMYVQMLRPIIWSGQKDNKFLLTTGFPKTESQAKAFEEQCCGINAIILATEKGNVVDMRLNAPSIFNIDSMFQKQFRLKQMDSWDFAQFQRHLGKTTSWGLITTRAYATEKSKTTGRSVVTDEMARLTNGCVIDMVQVAETCKKRLIAGTEQEEYEGEVPIAELEKDCAAIVAGDKAAGLNRGYLFDGFAHKSSADFVAWAVSAFGPPAYYLPITCKTETADAAWKKANEAEDVTEEGREEIKNGEATFNAQRNELTQCFTDGGFNMTKYEPLSTDASQETVFTDVKALVCAKIVIVNHDPRLAVDVSCANLAIKYNMLYLSVHQLIREHIRTNTAFGERLLKNRTQRELSRAFHQVSMVDQHDEMQYTAVHFDLHLVMELLNTTIIQQRTSQRYILIEGLCNGHKLAEESDQLNLRYMDELFLIEKSLGEVSAVVSLTYTKEEGIDEAKIQRIEFPAEEEVVVENKVLGEGEEEEEEAQAPAEEEEGEGDGKPKAMDPKALAEKTGCAWTITDRQQKNLLTLFTNMKGINSQTDAREANQYSEKKEEAVTASLDEFCTRISEENVTRNLYLQVIFNE